MKNVMVANDAAIYFYSLMLIMKLKGAIQI